MNPLHNGEKVVPHTTVETVGEEKINHPSHYGGDDVYECIKVAAAWGLLANACLFNVLKYICRAEKKGSTLEDLKKARWYLDYEIKRKESQRIFLTPEIAFNPCTHKNREIETTLGATHHKVVCLDCGISWQGERIL